MKKQTFLSGVLILFFAGVLAKILGAIYRLPLTWLLGAEGLGMYQLVYPLFSLILVLSSTGMPTAISRVTAGYVAKCDIVSARKTLKTSIKLLLAVSVIFAVLLASLSTLIATLQGNYNLYICYLGLVPAVIFVSIISAFRGYFQGCSNMLPTAISQLVEQGGKLIFGLLCGYVLLPYGVEYGAFGALLGVSLSELVTMVIMYIFYRKSRKIKYYSSQNPVHTTVHSTIKTHCNRSFYPVKTMIGQFHCPTYSFYESQPMSITISEMNRNKSEKVSHEICHKIIRNVIPITLSNAILPTVLFIESIFVVSLLAYSGISTQTATTLWGISSGIVGSLINMPIVLTQAVAIAIVPFVAVVRDRAVLQNRYNQSFGLSLIFCMPIVIAFILIGEPVLSILYGNSLTNSEVTLATQMLLVMSVSVIFGSLLQTQNNMLQGLGYGKITACNMAISAGVQVILFISLSITDLNIWGCVIASMVFYIMAYLLNYIVIRRKLQLKILSQSVVPALGGGVLLLLYIMNIGLLNLGNIFTVLLSVVGGGLVYLFGVWVWGGLDEIFARKKIKKSV